jgi:thymidylate synthase (FAD)
VADLFEPIQVRYVDHSGTDLTVVNAARVSFGRMKTVLDDQDKRLIQYLAKHNHWSPFSHPHITLWVKAPVFVRSQCFRHKIGFTENEISRRYVTTNLSFYLPRLRKVHPQKKQGSLPDPIDNEAKYLDEVIEWYRKSVDIYQSLISAGVAPEVARAVLPQGVMTEWYWTGSLYAWARFYGLRTAEDAQRETGEVAEKAAEIISKLFPVSWDALIRLTWEK